MKRQVRYTDRAVRDLAAISDWLTQPGAGLAARTRLRAIRSAIELLREFPCLYPLGPGGRYREAPCPGGYRAVYRLEPETGRNDSAGDVLVLRVFGPGQSRADQR